jgi:hypothetical protein
MSPLDRSVLGISPSVYCHTLRFDRCSKGVEKHPQRRLRALRRGVLAFVVTLVLGVSGIATAGILAGHGSSPTGPPAGHEGAEANAQDDGVHGGPIDRFHSAGSCDLAAIGSLSGNWTHGDYVSAVATAGNPAQIHVAAHSDCGKPMVALGHGVGPPEHALEHMAAGQAHAGNADDESSGTTGS